MKKSIISIMLALMIVVGMAVPAFAYWPSQGTNPYPAGAGGDVTQFVDNGVIYVAFTKNYNLTVMKKVGSSNWEVLGGTGFNANNYNKYGYVNDPSIYVYNGIPYVAYIEHYNYTYNPTVIKYNSDTNSWDIVGNQQITPDPQGSYSIDSNHQIVADSNNGKLYYSANYVMMYVSASGTPYIAINESILDDDHPLLSTSKVVVMEYNGGWNTIGFAGLGDYLCKGTPAIIRAEDTTYLAYYETDSSHSPYKNYLVVQHPAAMQSGPPTPETTGWGTNTKFEVNWSDQVQLKYDDGLYLCFLNTNEELEVVKRDPDTAAWSSLGEILLDTSEDDYSMTVFDGIPYVAYMGYYDSTAHVAKYNGTDWENLYYNNYTALPANVDDINLSNDNAVLYLTGTDMYGNLYTHYYNLPVNLEISQNTGGKYTISVGNESATFSDLSKTFNNFPGGYTIDLKFDALTGFEIKSVLIDGSEIISLPCQTATTSIITNRSHNIVATYAPTANDAAAPEITEEPTDKTVNAGETADLIVTASGTGALNYQWYSNSTESATGAAAIADATGSSYSAPTDTAGTTFYYCVVTNTDTSVTGKQTAVANSRIAKVIVNALIDAAAPEITEEPTDKTVNAGETADLAVAASGTGTLSYQWYSNSTESATGAAAITDATGSSYSAPIDTAGTTFYYCVVTNTDTSVTGKQTAVANSRIVKVTILDIAVEPIDQIISDVDDAIKNGQLKGNGGSDKLTAFVARLGDAKAAIEAGNKKPAINILESIYKQVDGKPSPKDIVVGDAAAEIALMIQALISSLK